MFVLLNGSFGIGKTTTAKALVARLASASIFDPEPLGIIMQKAATFVGRGRHIEDFQDVALWRRLSVAGARWTHFYTRAVIVPMAYSNPKYFEDLADALSVTAPVFKICLVAPLEVVLERLEKRALRDGTVMTDWVVRRARECCVAHTSRAFGYPIDATGSTTEIVQAIIVHGIESEGLR